MGKIRKEIIKRAAGEIEKKPWKLKVMDIAIAVLAVIVVLNAATLINDCAEMREHYVPSKDSMIIYYGNGDYERIAGNILEYPAAAEKKDIREYYALGQYYINRMLYQGYVKAGDAESADILMEKMDRYAQEMGSLREAQDKIDEILRK